MATCKGCGKRIVWGILKDGCAVPLDPTPPTYRIIGHDASGAPKVRLLELEPDTRERRAMVLHHVTCPERDRFRSNR